MDAGGELFGWAYFYAMEALRKCFEPKHFIRNSNGSMVKNDIA